MSGRLIVVAGPTATGKTRLGIELARRFNGEILSADSMQIYRGMDIGTAKATAAERAEAVHHMLDVADPWEDYSVSRYVQEASRVCDRLLAAGKTPIVVGGTGLYIDSLLAGREFSGRQEGDETLRRELNADYDRLGGEAMRELLRSFDAERAEKLHPADRRRIIRAIEVYRLTGKTITQHDAETRAQPKRYEALRLVLNYAERADLYARIDRRVDQMVSEGLFEEVAGLLAAGLSAESTAMQAIGYKETARALAGEISREVAIEQIKQSSRRYAKRQLTWFGREPGAHWILWDKSPDFPAALAQVEALVSTECAPRSEYHRDTFRAEES